jgi:hypothetical protein
VARQPDRVGILLDRGLGDLLGCLVQTGVDDLEPGVPKTPSDHLDPAVVTVQAGFRDDDPVLAGHVGQSIDAPADAACHSGSAMDETSVTEISDVRCARSWISIAYQVDKRGTGRRRSSSPGP